MPKANYDELVESLKKLAAVKKVDTGVDLMAKNEKIGSLGGKILKDSAIRRLRGELKKRGTLLILEKDLKDKRITSRFVKIILDGFEFDNPNDLFYFMKKSGFAGAFDAKTKQLILTGDDLTRKPTEYLVFHEKAHLQHFEEFGDVYHTLKPWERETYVFEQIWKTKHLWTADELRHALEYVNTVRTRGGQKPLNYKL